MYLINTSLKNIKPIALILFFLLTFNTYANEAKDWFDKGHVASQVKDYKQAAKWWLKSAEQGDAEAQYYLGFMYENGQGVPQDYKQAAKWYLKSAEQGDADAQYNLGIMYESGQGLPQDYKQAAKWWLKSAEQGHAEAQYNLGIMYENGLGVIPSNKKAYAWFALAAMSGDKSAVKNRDLTAKKLSPSKLEEAQELAAKLYERISKK